VANNGSANRYKPNAAGNAIINTLRRHLVFRPRLVWQDAGVRRVCKLLLPALFGVSIAQLGLLLDTVFASFLPGGSIAWLYYSSRLVYFPLGIFGVALATVILPQLSRQYVDQSAVQFSITMDWALRSVLIIALPAALGLYLLAEPLFATLFHYGKFHARDVHMAAFSLRAYAFGLPAFMLVKVLVSGFYARQNIKTPVHIAAFALLLNVVLNFLLIWHLRHAGLALATALASTVNAGWLAWQLQCRGYFQPQAGWGKYLLQLLTAVVVMCVFLAWFSPPTSAWMAWSWHERAFSLFALITALAVIYFSSLYLVGLRLRAFILKTHSVNK